MYSSGAIGNKFKDRVLVNRYNPTYFVSSNKGSDSNDGLTEQTPWETLSKVQTESSGFTSGDIIAFRGGDEFYGNLSFTGLTGVSGSPITFTSYGTGKTIISGEKVITGFTTSGGNIWSADTGSDDVHQVFKDGDVITNGRLPLIGDDNNPPSSYYLVTSGSASKNTFQSDDLIGLNLTGATVHMGSERWKLQARTITIFNNTTGDVTLDSDVLYTIDANDRFFVNGHENLLTAQDEWHYDTNTLSIYSITEPTNITINTVDDNGITLVNSDYITIDNLKIKKFNKNGIDLTTSNNCIVDNTDIEYCYFRGVDSHTSNNFTFTNGTVSYSNSRAINVDGTDSNISNNSFTNIGRFKNVTTKEMDAPYVISNSGDRMTLSNNSIIDVGYLGISWIGANSIIEENYIENMCLTLDDGAAIYSYNSNWANVGASGSIVRQNTIIGLDFQTIWFANGIYFDDRTHDLVATLNSIRGTYYGMYMHNSDTNTFTYNNIYKTKTHGIYLHEDSLGGVGNTIDNIIQNNDIYLLDKTIQPIKIRTTGTSNFDNMVTLDNNKYWNPYLDNQVRGQTSANTQNYPLELWKSSFVQDANSTTDNLYWNDFILDVTNSVDEENDFSVDTSNFFGGFNITTQRLSGATGDFYYEGTSTATSNSYLRFISANIVSGTTYLLKFDAKTDDPNLYCRVDFVQPGGSYTQYKTTPFYPTTSWKSYEIAFTADFTYATTNIWWYLPQGTIGNKLMIDNFSLSNVDISVPIERDYFVYNETSRTKNVQIPAGPWEDLDGNKYNNAITLEPYTSEILLSLTTKYYYVANDGLDTNDGLTEQTPWQTLAKVETESSGFTSGTTVSFRGGDEFYGNLTLSNVDGSSDFPVTFTSYGTGKATITSSVDVTGWTNTGGNIWSASTGSDDVYQVFKDDIFTSISSSQYYTVDSVANAKNQFTCDVLGGQGLDLVGASILVYTQDYAYQVKTVTVFNTTTGEITLGSNTIYDINVGEKFRIHNHSTLLLAQDDWMFNYTTKILSMYSVSEPTNISAAVNTISGIVLNTCDYITIDNLQIEKFNVNGIYLNTCNNIQIRNNKFYATYDRGIYSRSDTYTTVYNNTFDIVLRLSIELGYTDNHSTNGVIDNNIISNVGLTKHATTRDKSYTVGMTISGDLGTIKNNKLYEIAYNGITFHTGASLIINNYIENYCVDLSDGGGIYHYNGTLWDAPGDASGSVIESNIIVNNNEEYKNADNVLSGIYMDNKSQVINIYNNVIINSGRGIFLNNPRDIDVDNNVIFNTLSNGISISENVGGVTGITITNNEVYLETPQINRYPFQMGTFESTSGSTLATSDFNKFYNPAQKRNLSFKSAIITHNSEGEIYTLPAWRTTYSQDINSIENDFYYDGFIANVTGSELLTNGDFGTGDTTGWGTTTSTISIKQDNGNDYLSIIPSTQTWDNAYSDQLTLTAGTQYLLEFDVRSLVSESHMVFILENEDPYHQIFNAPIWSTANVWVHYKFIVSADLTQSNWRVAFRPDAIGRELDIDNVTLKEATFTDQENKSMVVYNETSTAKYVPINYGWSDLNGDNYYNDRVELQPYTSKIFFDNTLVKFDANDTVISVSGLTNVIGPDWTVVRDSIASYSPTPSTVVEVAAHVPRIENGVALAESLAINLMPYNEDIDNNSYYAQTLCTVTDSTEINPRGEASCSLLSITTLGGRTTRSVTSVSLPCVQSLWVKKAPISGATHTIIGGNNDVAWSTGDSRKYALTDEWQRIESPVITDNGDSIFWCGTKDKDNVSHDDCLGDVLVWGWDTVEEATVSSYIRNNPAANQTREADKITMTVPEGVTEGQTWLNGVRQSRVSLTAGSTFTMVNGTTKIIMR